MTTSNHTLPADASLLEMFNVQFIDFVHKNKDGTFTPVEWPRYATHELVPTAWNKPVEVKGKNGKRTKETVHRVEVQFALAVCAVPLRRKEIPANLRVRKRVKLAMHPYRKDASDSAKRKIIEGMARAAKTPAAFWRQLKTLDGPALDKAYLRLCTALRQTFKPKAK